MRRIDIPFCLYRHVKTCTGVVRQCGVCLAAAPVPLIERLDPPLWASVVAALIGLVLLGLGLMLFAGLMARWVRRTTRRSAAGHPKGGLGPSDWEPQPWTRAERDDSDASWDNGADE